MGASFDAASGKADAAGRGADASPRRSVTRLSILSSVSPATEQPRAANMNCRLFAFANSFWAPLATRVHLRVHTTLGTTSWTPCASRVRRAG